MSGAEWVILNGAMAYLDSPTRERLAVLKANMKYPKRDGIPLMIPRACSFGIEDVNKCVYKEKNKKGKEIEKADWSKLTLT